MDLVIEGSYQAVAFSALGLALLGLGFALVNVLTPGDLGKLIWQERNAGASLFTASALVSQGIIIITSIRASDDDFVWGLIDTGVFSVIGLVLFAIAFKLTDALEHGPLGQLICEKPLHPAVAVTAATNLVIAGILSASIL